MYSPSSTGPVRPILANEGAALQASAAEPRVATKPSHPPVVPRPEKESSRSLPAPPAPTVPNLLHYSAAGFLTARCLVERLVLLGLAREGGTMLPEPG
jgi:hypothetical protein